MTRSREAAALLALLVGFAGCEGGPAPGARPAPPSVVRGVGVETVAAVTVREGQDVVGTVRSKAQMLIASKAQGYVREVHARPGDQVEPGRLLVVVSLGRELDRLRLPDGGPLPRHVASQPPLVERPDLDRHPALPTASWARSSPRPP